MNKSKKKMVEVAELDLQPITKDDLSDVTGMIWNEDVVNIECHGGGGGTGCSSDCPSYPPAN